MNKRTALRFAVALALGCVLLCTPATAQKAGRTKAAPPGEPVHYFNGAFQVDLSLALDELVAKPVKAADSVNNLLPGAQTRAVNGGGTVSVKLAAPVASRAELQTRADKLSAAGYEVKAVLKDNTGRGVREVVTRQLSVKLKAGVDLNGLLSAYNLRLVEQVTYSPDTYILHAESGDLLAALDAANAIFLSGAAEFATPIVEKQRERRFVPNDPLFANQWHLRNTAQAAAGTGAIAGTDVNVVPAWDEFTGTGVNIAIVDDGLQVAHPDLAGNARTDLDIDILQNDLDPTPVFDASHDDFHGTPCAGLAAAVGNNGTGVIGSAFGAKLIGVRLISSESITDDQEAAGLGHRVSDPVAANRVSVSSNSWGPPDAALLAETFMPLAEAAVANAVATGRGGHGTVFLWAAGNGFEDGDHSGYDGLASSRYTIAVAASTSDGHASEYSEQGAALMVNAPSSWGSTGITTVDVTGANGMNADSYTSGFGGTSAATPIAAGVVALILQANPYLGWRDVQHILSLTAAKNNPTAASWANNGAGRHFSHDYGFGRIDAKAAVDAAKTWYNVPVNATPLARSEAVVTAIPDNNATGIARTVNVAAPAGFVAEHVEVTVNVTHTWRGDLQYELQAPTGMTSVLAAPRPGDGEANLVNWMFTSVAHMGENPNGNWTLRVKDLAAEDVGQLNNWSIRIYGYIADNDQDNDGFLDTQEGLADTDGDGNQNYVDTDSDNDSLSDASEGWADIDGDTKPNLTDTDSDGDGASDASEAFAGTNPYDPNDVPELPVGAWPLTALGLALAGAFAARRRGASR